jgi:hypothetical protein
VWQKVQVSVQPTWDEMHSVPRFLFGDIDRLDLVPAGNAHQVLARSIGADLAADDLRHLDHELLGQKRAVVLGQVGHLRKVAHAPVIDPLPDLAHPHLGLPLRRTRRDQCVAQLVARQTDKVDRPALGQLAGDGDDILRDRGFGGGHGVLWRQDAGYRRFSGKTKRPGRAGARKGWSGLLTCSAFRLRSWRR